MSKVIDFNKIKEDLSNKYVGEVICPVVAEQIKRDLFKSINPSGITVSYDFSSVVAQDAIITED